jgi:Holliday junction resolvase RusA-like endonuclease
MTGAQMLVIPDWLPAQLANSSHGHWSTRQKKLRDAQIRVFVCARNADLQPIRGRARLTITLVFPNKRRRDIDNLNSRIKGVCDGLVRGGWLVDDSPEWLDLSVRAEVRPHERATELVLEPIV